MIIEDCLEFGFMKFRKHKDAKSIGINAYALVINFQFSFESAVDYEVGFK